MLGTTRFLGLWQAVVLIVFADIFVTIVATWDAVHFAKKQHPVKEKKKPDPWFAVFVSFIVGIFGYVYLRKWEFAILWVILATLGILSFFIIKSTLYAHLLILIFVTSVPIHVYTRASMKSQPIMEKAALFLFTVLILVSFWAAVVRPYINHKIWNLARYN